MSRPRKTHKHLPKYVTVIHGSFWYGPPGEKRTRICPEADESAMYKFMSDKLAPTGPLFTVKDLLTKYAAEILPTLEPRTQKDYRRHINNVLIPTFGHMGVNELKNRDIGRFLDVQKGKIQRNRQVAVLSAAYTQDVSRWYNAESNPCTRVRRNKSKPRDRYATDAEYAALYAMHGPRMQVAMDLALLTGQRQGKLITLHWSKVTPEGIEFQTANKGGRAGKRLLVAMSPALEAVLNRARALLPHLPREYVLRRRDGKPYSENGFRAIWQRVMRQYVKAGGTRFTFHDLRAKSVSDSGSLQDAMERAGHTSMAMTRGVYDRGVRKVTPLR
jgi:integrase